MRDLTRLTVQHTKPRLIASRHRLLRDQSGGNSKLKSAVRTRYNVGDEVTTL